jgi:hypothetical protein
MQRLIFSGLTIALMSAIASPALALMPRFEDARQHTLDKGLISQVKLDGRFDRAMRENLDKGNTRFDRAMRENLDKGNTRFDRAMQENLDKGGDRFDQAMQENLDKLNERFESAQQENLNK